MRRFLAILCLAACAVTAGCAGTSPPAASAVDDPSLAISGEDVASYRTLLAGSDDLDEESAVVTAQR
jgi:hypothetical protein